MEKTASPHSPLLVALTVLNLVLFLVNQLFSLLGSSIDLLSPDTNIFGNTIGNISAKLYLEITPSSRTFSIWGAIYIWQAAWMVYSLACLCRRAPTGPVYTSPTLLTTPFFCVSMLNWLVVMSWQFAWGWERVWLAFVILALTFITIYICIGLSYRALSQHTQVLLSEKRQVDIWLTRALVQNGLAFYGTWCTIATLLNLASALTYDVYPRFEQSTSSTIALGILAAELLFFSLTDWTIMDKYSRYTFSPYIVVIVALSGSMSKNWNPPARNSIFTAVLLGVTALCFVIKLVLMVWRHLREGQRKVFTPTTE